MKDISTFIKLAENMTDREILVALIIRLENIRGTLDEMREGLDV